MNNRYFLSIFLCLFCTVAFSQNRLTGNVVDTSQEPLAFANVILLNAKDSVSVIKGTVTEEDGTFILNDLAEETYLLKVTFVGYEDYLKRVKLKNDTHLKNITVSQASGDLDEITIQARKPKISREVDRIVFDVENSTLSTGNTWDILKKSPGVIDNQGQLMVRNSAVQVYLNDRKIYLSASELQTLLQSYSAENIKSIEIITNPPAKYDAEGGAILNITTSKPISAGYKGSVEGSFTQAIYSKFKLGTSHFFQGDKVDVFANYSFSPRKDYKNDDSYINFMRDGSTFSRYETDFTRVTTSQAHNANAIIDFELSENSSLNFSINAHFSPDKEFDNDVTTTIKNSAGVIDTTLVTDSRVLTNEDNVALNLDYQTTFKNSAELSVKAHYTRFDQNRNQYVLSQYYNPNQERLKALDFTTDANQEIDIYTAQVDYDTKLKNSSLSFGGKYSGIESTSGIDYIGARKLTEKYDNLEDTFLYDENIFAAYATISHDWENWSGKLGLRGEYTDRTGESLSVKTTNDREYFELFPTAYLQYRASEAHSFTLDYSRRIQRPRYESLNPFRYFLNETNYNAGNPNLTASISNNFNLNYTLKNSWFFDLYYNDLGETPEILNFQDNQQLTIRNVNRNLLGSKSYGIDIFHGTTITSFWYAQLFTSIFHQENTFLAVESGNAEVTREAEGVQAYAYNIFTLSQDGTFEGTLFVQYVSDYLSGSYELDPMTTVSIGLRKTLWDNRAELSLNLNDIFNTTNTRLTSNYLNQDNSFASFAENRSVQVGFKYNFGNFRLTDNQRSIDATERERL
ncbi:TonB-dependent receptor domain-containing protein [Christiangramia aquimixticola]|uniref:TonB-dependent receptor domain-containing protein n=1 Tax=Christiangramia aquimixticola TaxID=1697558 RepID=UPI003AA986AF